jgi:large subunit ribosomal protein L25
METIVLKVEKRTILRKKVKALRRSGITPANIFGHTVESQAIQVDTAEAEKVLAKAGATHMITLKGASFKEGRRVLTKGVQRNCLTGKLIHIDFHQISMKDKVRVVVPIVFHGVAPASRRKDLVMLESLKSLEVECLPDSIPDSIEVDRSSLAEAGDHILAGDLKLGDKVTLITHPEDVVARVVTARIVEEVKAAPVAEEAVEGAASTEEEAAKATEAQPAEKAKKQSPKS